MACFKDDNKIMYAQHFSQCKHNLNLRIIMTNNYILFSVVVVALYFKVIFFSLCPPKVSLLPVAVQVSSKWRAHSKICLFNFT